MKTRLIKLWFTERTKVGQHSFLNNDTFSSESFTSSIEDKSKSLENVSQFCFNEA